MTFLVMWAHHADFARAFVAPVARAAGCRSSISGAPLPTGHCRRWRRVSWPR